jgi:hypothetical protein
MPVLSFATKNQQCGISVTDAWVKHNPSLSSLLIAGDTIVLQVKKRFFLKQ